MQRGDLTGATDGRVGARVDETRGGWPRQRPGRWGETDTSTDKTNKGRMRFFYWEMKIKLLFGLVGERGNGWEE